MIEKEFHTLAKRIAKENPNVRVKFGKTNGETNLHVYVPGSNTLGATIKSYSEWEDHPANSKKEEEYGKRNS